METGKSKKSKKNDKKSAKKMYISGFDAFKEKMDITPRNPRENFRSFAERLGVPSDDVAEFKYWLRDQK